MNNVDGFGSNGPAVPCATSEPETPEKLQERMDGVRIIDESNEINTTNSNDNNSSNTNTDAPASTLLRKPTTAASSRQAIRLPQRVNTTRSGTTSSRINTNQHNQIPARSSSVQDHGGDDSVSLTEVLFLIVEFLRHKGLHNPAKLLEEELPSVLPPTVNWNREVRPTTIEGLRERYPHIKPDHLSGLLGKLMQQNNLLRNQYAPSLQPQIQTLLGACSYSLLSPPFPVTNAVATTSSTAPTRKATKSSATSSSSAALVPLHTAATTSTSIIQHNYADVVVPFASTRRLAYKNAYRPEQPVNIADFIFARMISSSTHKRQALAFMAAAKHFRELKEFIGHVRDIYCVLFDKTGSRIITGSDDRLVKIWNVDTGYLQYTLRGHTGDIMDMKISPDNRFIASASNDNMIRIWRLENCHPVCVLRGHTDAITSLSFFPFDPFGDSNRLDDAEKDLYFLLSTSIDGTARIWTIQPSKAAQQLSPLVINFNHGPDHQSHGTDQQTSVEDNLTIPPTAHSPTLPSSPVSASTSTTSTSGTRGAGVTRSRGRQSAAQPQIMGGCFNKTGSHLAAGYNDGLVYLMPVTKDMLLSSATRGHNADHNNNNNSNGNDNNSPSSLGSHNRWIELPGHTAVITHLSFNNKGDRLCTGSKDGTVRIWTVPNNNAEKYSIVTRSSALLRLPPCIVIDLKPATNAEQPKKQAIPNVNMVMWTLDDSMIVVSTTKGKVTKLKVFDTTTGKFIRNLEAHEKEVFVMSPHPTAKRLFVSAGYDGRVCLWDIYTGAQLKEFAKPEAFCDGMFSPNGDLFVASDKHGAITLYGFVHAENFVRGDKFASHRKYELVPDEQYFFYDYDPLTHDLNDYAYDTQNDMAPHELDRILCNSSGTPYERQPYVTGEIAFERPLVIDSDREASQGNIHPLTITDVDLEMPDATRTRVTMARTTDEDFAPPAEADDSDDSDFVVDENDKEFLAAVSSSKRRRKRIRTRTMVAAGILSDEEPSSSEQSEQEEETTTTTTPERTRRGTARTRLSDSTLSTRRRSRRVSGATDEEEPEAAAKRRSNRKTTKPKKKSTRSEIRQRRGGYAWLQGTQYDPDKYIPQMHDIVLYFKQGHEDYCDEYDDERPKEELDQVLECKVIGIDYKHPTKRQEDGYTVCEVTLQILYAGYRGIAFDWVYPKQTRSSSGRAPYTHTTPTKSASAAATSVPLTQNRYNTRRTAAQLANVEAALSNEIGGASADTAAVSDSTSSFKVLLRNNSTSPDFLILKSRFEAAVMRDIKQNSRVKVRFDNDIWEGTVIKKIDRLATWEPLLVKWDPREDEDEDENGKSRVNIWEVLPEEQGDGQAEDEEGEGAAMLDSDDEELLAAVASPREGSTRRQKGKQKAKSSSSAPAAATAAALQQPVPSLPATTTSELLDLVSQLRSDEKFELFAEPVDIREYRDYPSQVPLPMDLSLIQQRLSFGYYRSLHAVLFDSHLILRDAIAYNGPDDDVVTEPARELFHRLSSRIIELMPPDERAEEERRLHAHEIKRKEILENVISELDLDASDDVILVGNEAEQAPSHDLQQPEEASRNKRRRVTVSSSSSSNSSNSNSNRAGASTNHSATEIVPASNLTLKIKLLRSGAGQPSSNTPSKQSPPESPKLAAAPVRVTRSTSKKRDHDDMTDAVPVTWSSSSQAAARHRRSPRLVAAGSNSRNNDDTPEGSSGEGASSASNNKEKILRDEQTAPTAECLSPTIQQVVASFLFAAQQNSRAEPGSEASESDEDASEESSTVPTTPARQPNQTDGDGGNDNAPSASNSTSSTKSKSRRSRFSRRLRSSKHQDSETGHANQDSIDSRSKDHNNNDNSQPQELQTRNHVRRRAAMRPTNYKDDSSSDSSKDDGDDEDDDQYAPSSRGVTRQRRR